MKAIVIQFSGSNCDRDLVHAMRNDLGWDVDLVWYQKALDQLDNYDAIFLPGGFSYGDYLRAGIIAAFTPVMAEVKKKAQEGMPIVGICNGFQILVEAELLPGALLGNESLKFCCKWVTLRVDSIKSCTTTAVKKGDLWHIPVNHGEGRYFLDKKGLDSLRDNDQIIWRYATDTGEITEEANPNGAVENIAGICNQEGNVVGLMPHPERATDKLLSPKGTEDGKLFFQSIAEFVRRS
jgi:phosphoribosylformylglycinamidine synthase